MDISFDAASTGSIVNTPGSGVTISHTCAAGSGLYVATFEHDSGSYVTGVTYNGSALTLLKNKTSTFVYAQRVSIWYTNAPTSGTHDIVITTPYNAKNYVAGVGLSYLQVSRPGETTGSESGTNFSTSWTDSLTTTRNNSWVLYAPYDVEANSISAGTGFTVRGSISSLGVAFGDNGGAQTPPGTVSITANGQNGVWVDVMAAIVPKLKRGDFLINFL